MSTPQITKKVAIFDVDGVLADFENDLVEYLKGYFGNDALINRNLYSIRARYKKHPKILKAALDFVDDPNSYYSLNMLNWMSELVKFVSECGHPVFYLTNRHETAKSFTMRWLKKNDFPNSNRVLCTQGHSKSVVVRDVFKKERVSFVMDDNPDELYELLKCGVNTICMAQEWNEGIFPRLMLSTRGEFMVWEAADEEEIGFADWVDKLE